jgi:hypothetical protein
LEEIEKDFWKFCEDEKNLIKVRYAADLSYKTFLSKGDIQEIQSDLYKKGQWNFLSLYLDKNSLFQFIKENQSAHISGLTVPWLYFGMLFSTFCWHVEDLYLYSLNYMHYGNPKIWYGIPHTEKEKMDEYIKKKINSKEFKSHDPNIMHKLILLINPKELKENGITIYKAVQNPGELIFTIPKAYHAGFSTGFNISEAVNLAVKSFL